MRTLVFLLYADLPCLTRLSGGRIVVNNFGALAEAIGVHRDYVKEDLKHLQTQHLVFNMTNGYNTSEFSIARPRLL